MSPRDERGRRDIPKPSIDPVARKPPRAPERAKAETGPTPVARPRLVPLAGRAPEDVAIDAEGRVYTGVEDG